MGAHRGCKSPWISVPPLCFRLDSVRSGTRQEQKQEQERNRTGTGTGTDTHEIPLSNHEPQDNNKDAKRNKATKAASPTSEAARAPLGSRNHAQQAESRRVKSVHASKCEI